MTRFLSLISFTENGSKDVGNSIQRAENFRSEVEKAGGKVVAQYWAVGAYDGAVIFEAPDETTAASLLVNLGHDGFVRTRTMRVFDSDEFGKIAAGA